ncbi:MAG: hypothetical protein KDA84_23685, partial [Planctomycetaceae bacterium]|nr:hypothetical protein [Planctomycetaceae bacterium]
MALFFVMLPSFDTKPEIAASSTAMRSALAAIMFMKFRETFNPWQGSERVQKSKVNPCLVWFEH